MIMSRATRTMAGRSVALTTSSTAAAEMMPISCRLFSRKRMCPSFIQYEARVMMTTMMMMLMLIQNRNACAAWHMLQLLNCICICIGSYWSDIGATYDWGPTDRSSGRVTTFTIVLHRKLNPVAKQGTNAFSSYSHAPVRYMILLQFCTRSIDDVCLTDSVSVRYQWG